MGWKFGFLHGVFLNMITEFQVKLQCFQAVYGGICNVISKALLFAHRRGKRIVPGNEIQLLIRD